MTLVKLTADQQARLIQYALEQLLGDLAPRRKARPEASNGHQTGRGGKPWTDAQRAKFATTMQNVWKAKRKAGAAPKAVPPRKAQRAKSAEFLAGFSTTDPRKPAGTPASRGMGSYVRRGYLKAKGDGYVRTAKPYVP